MIVYPKSEVKDSIYTGTWTDKKIPVYTVLSENSLNQFVGYVKHINAGNGTVLCRGQCQLHPSISPSVMRGRETESLSVRLSNLEQVINKIAADNHMLDFWRLNESPIKGWKLYQQLAIEATLQHYGASTRCVDFVDNHWTALWFGLCAWDDKKKRYFVRDSYKTDKEKEKETQLIEFDYKISPSNSGPQKPRDPVEEDIQGSRIKKLQKKASQSGKTYAYFLKEELERLERKQSQDWKNACEDFRNNSTRQDFLKDYDKGHMYLFLYVAETNYPTWRGISFGDNTFVVDLRKMLPSYFLRPCSQHGWIVRGKEIDYCYENNIACVIRINIDLVKRMLGNGSLTSVERFFPSEMFDEGYNVLLQRQKGSNIGSKKKYQKIIPRGTISTSFKEK